MKKTKVMVVVGHGEVDNDKIVDYGSENKKLGITEYEYAMDVVVEVFKMENFEDIDLVIKRRNGSYRNLPNEINEYNPDFVVSVHTNAYNNSVQGTETLYWHSSDRSMNMAQVMQNCLVESIGLNDRGIKYKKNGDRGATILRATKMPCIITEGVFIDSLECSNQYVKEYAKGIVNGIRNIVDLKI